MKNTGEKKTYANLLVILVIAALVLGWYFMSQRSSETKALSQGQELVLSVAPIRPQDMTIQNSYIGYVTPINSVSIQPYISGFLEDIMVKGGEEVNRGDTMIIIRQDEYKANLDAAKAKVMQAQADFNNAEIYYRRMKQAGIKVISKTELDNAKASYLSAQAALAQAKANQELAKVNYDYTVIQAPISGVVGNVDLTRGDYVSPASSSLLKIIQYDPIRVVFSITDKEYLDELKRNAQQLFADEKIQVRLSNGQIFKNPGQFKYLDNEINRSTNSIAVYADFPNSERTLVANAYVDVLVERRLQNVVPISQSRVTMDSKGNFIYTVRDGKLVKTPIEILHINTDNYLVKNTFAPDEYLVLDKIGTLDPKQKIKINIVKPAKPAGEKK